MNSSKKRRPEPHQAVVPEYQPLPKGMWHFIGAVVMTLSAIGALLSIAMSWVGTTVDEQTTLRISMGTLVAVVLTVVTATFLLTRGRAHLHNFLLGFNLALVVGLVIGGIAGLATGEHNLAVTAGIGLLFALLARVAYKTQAYADCVEYYRVIWQWHRVNRK